MPNIETVQDMIDFLQKIKDKNLPIMIYRRNPDNPYMGAVEVGVNISQGVAVNSNFGYHTTRRLKIYEYFSKENEKDDVVIEKLCRQDRGVYIR